MTTTSPQASSSPLPEAIAAAAATLPHQGPIEVFVHQNTLSSFEGIPFERALSEAGELYGAEHAIRENFAREAFAAGRITKEDLIAALPQDDAQDNLLPGITNNDFRIAMFLDAKNVTRASSIIWLLEENSELGKFDTACAAQERIATESIAFYAREFPIADRQSAGRLAQRFQPAGQWVRLEQHLQRIFSESWSPQSVREPERFRALTLLWACCLDQVFQIPEPMLPRSNTKVSGTGGRSPVNHYLIRLSESFLDQGLARWPLPGREHGFLKACLRLFQTQSIATPEWLSRISELAKHYEHHTALEVLEELLSEADVPVAKWPEFLKTMALRLRGWGGLFNHLEHHAHLLDGYPAPVPCSFAEFLAVRLLLERANGSLVETVEKEADRADRTEEDVRLSLAYDLFHICQRLGISGPALLEVPVHHEQGLFRELLCWQEYERRVIWQRAYEQHLRDEVLVTLAAGAAERAASASAAPKLQVVCCIDDREESFRRYFEEESNDIQTFGTAGFFGLDIKYAPLGGHAGAYCPVQLTPGHRVFEVPRNPLQTRYRSWQAARRAWHSSRKVIAGSSVSSVAGVAVHTFIGALASVPLMGRVLFPRLLFRFRRFLENRVLKRQDLSELLFTAEDMKRIASQAAGYTVEEMANQVFGLLRTIGLRPPFAPYVLILGHGSFSRNNPMRSAYDCGACGGHPGAINAQVIARMANMPAVREELRRTRDLEIPAETIFVGGYHNTCTDEITLFDFDLTSPTVKAKELLSLIERVRGKNALERTRRFPIALKKGDYEKALAYVEWRSQHIGEPRPEFGHATNAICYVGSREATRGLFFDRRSFLVSYDPARDLEGNILLQILSAVIPVCSGISLEYFFSALDNEVYGAGSKLPQNVTCLLGVMTGYESDLRTGLPKQMIDIHEPTRLLFVIETSEALMRSVLDRNPVIKKIVENEWVMCALYDPATNATRVHCGQGRFEEWKTPAHCRPVFSGNNSEAYTIGTNGLLPFAVLQGNQVSGQQEQQR